MTELNRETEKERYEEVYKNPRYRMGLGRVTWACDRLRDYPRGSSTLLDVGTGRGELVVAGIALGFSRAWGLDGARNLRWGRGDYQVVAGNAWDLPFDRGEWDVVTCLDVLEHLVKDDVEKVLSELFRVSNHRVLVTASNTTSVYTVEVQGRPRDLHITKLPYSTWDRMVRTAARRDGKPWLVQHSGKVGCGEGWDCQLT